MELPNYSRQLLQQLYTLCKEQQFCDCTISIGTIYFRAHKLVLAAASLLFKTLLDNTDTISIDASVVSPEEFALLLEMVYTGRLPVGKHNFSKIISLADSLQMFDVAVSCKTLLTSLVNCSVQGQVVRDVSAPPSESLKEGPEKPEVKILSSQGAGELHSSPEGSGKVGTQEAIHVDAQEMSVDPPPAQEVQGGADAPGEPPHTAAVSSPSPVAQAFGEAKAAGAEPEEERKYQLNFLLENESIFSDALLVTQDVLTKLEECSEIKGVQKETIMGCLTGEEGRLAFQRILDKVRDESLNVQSVVSLLQRYQDSNPAVKAALLGRKPEDGDVVRPKALSPPGSTEEGRTLSALLLEHKEDLIQCVTQLRPIMEFLETAKEEFLTGTEKRVILNCCEGGTPKETIENLLNRMSKERSLTAESLVKLLQAVKMMFPNLALLLENLQKLATLPNTTVQASPDDYGTELLRRYHENLSEIFTDNQVLLKMIPHVKSLAPGEREVMEKLVKRDSGSGGFTSLMSAVLEKQALSATAVWQLLMMVQETKTCPLSRLMEEIRREPGADAFFRAVTTPESAALEIILRHHRLILEAVQHRREDGGFTSEEERLAETMLGVSSEPASPRASARAAPSRAMGKSASAWELCQLLCSARRSCPGLQPVVQELASAGFLTQENGGEETWKVSNKFHLETNDKADEQAAEPGEEDCQSGKQNDQGETGSLAEQQEKGTSSSPDSAKKSFICKACDKSFHFYCRLKVHMKRCRAAKSKQVQCKECSETKDSKRELEKHQLEAHGAGGEPDVPKKKKKRLPVTCDLCGREFAHASGMQYHKLTEHFDEKPFSCEECGAKFAANSTLKNHLRLHTGDRPFMCKHCLMTFTQASALAYHTKKKHSEGKMYACQYCDAVFAQSIELSRHVRTHTGDKPYVCRDCGKGFRQANGLSIHLHTFHNIEDPYDCKKCRMSFPTLQDHRKHIHEVHSKEYHPCPTCGKIFSAPSMLERHMVTHVGGKPFSCGICNKAYQQLSGLWYHNRTHHPDVFAAQNHRSSKFSSLQCSSCDKTFPNTVEHKKHIKTEHADMKFHECDQCKELFPTPALLQVHIKCQHSGSQPFRCLYCAATFRFPGALQHHVTTEHFKQSESTFPCELCGELFTSQAQLEGHLESEHPKVMGPETQAATSQVVQVIQTPEPPVAATEQVITLEETQLAGSQVFVALPDSQTSQASSELVAVTVEDLLDGTVTLICGEAKRKTYTCPHGTPSV
ncbi:zinc finger and BTB domain-containing protein 40 isoform X2 [Artibeus jamaicensis]|uniref:zinc finger and BTB domain-containing protein 40 isoform X2 n=1 Tax=Artibeus jamaicensis TaxID=9417 RepID=UPI00235AD6C5|nr:zinc finger and BTB domain-containing protein 40 isoform X2 [Artibeus jamaicensis]